MAVKALVNDPISKRVSSVLGRSQDRSASPYARSKTVLPPWLTRTAPENRPSRAYASTKASADLSKADCARAEPAAHGTRRTQAAKKNVRVHTVVSIRVSRIGRLMAESYHERRREGAPPVVA